MDIILTGLLIAIALFAAFLIVLEILEIRKGKRRDNKRQLFRDFDQSVKIGNHK